MRHVVELQRPENFEVLDVVLVQDGLVLLPSGPFGVTSVGEPIGGRERDGRQQYCYTNFLFCHSCGEKKPSYRTHPGEDGARPARIQPLPTTRMCRNMSVKSAAGLSVCQPGLPALRRIPPQANTRDGSWYPTVMVRAPRSVGTFSTFSYLPFTCLMMLSVVAAIGVKANPGPDQSPHRPRPHLSAQSRSLSAWECRSRPSSCCRKPRTVSCS